MDLFKITKSKTRTAILKHYFFNKDEKFYLRQLERILGVSVGNIRRELIALHKLGLFNKEKMGNQTYYFLNKDMPFFNELKKIVSKTIGVEAILKEVLEKVKGMEISFIYGSLARETEDKLSDIDLFVIGKVQEDDLLKAVKKAEEKISREINYVIFTKEDILEAIKKEKVFVKDVLGGKKTFLIGDSHELGKIVRAK